MRRGPYHRLCSVVTVGVITVAMLAALASPAAAAKRPDTVIDTAPPALTTSTTATFTFHSTVTPATFTCQLDAGARRRARARAPTPR